MIETLSFRQFVFLNCLLSGIMGASILEHDFTDGSGEAQFRYLGHVTHSHKKGAKSISSYFLSQNSAGYATAQADCTHSIGDDSTLVDIETKEELGNITNFLAATDDTGSSYWIGGKYVKSQAGFQWSTGAAFGPWAPWDQGHPNSRLPITRVAAYTAAGPLKFRTQFQTVSNRYICEMTSGSVEEGVVPCYTDNDLVIVVDSSGSIGQDHYLVALEFTTRLATAWVDHPGNRVSVIRYSNSASTIFGLGQKLTIGQIRDIVYNSPYEQGGTASHLGLAEAVGEFELNARHVPRNLVFLTDGNSNDPKATLDAAQEIKELGIRSFAEGIGSGIHPEELLGIAGGNGQRVFNADGFQDLLKLLQPISRSVCAT